MNFLQQIFRKNLIEEDLRQQRPDEQPFMAKKVQDFVSPTLFVFEPPQAEVLRAFSYVERGRKLTMTFDHDVRLEVRRTDFCSELWMVDEEAQFELNLREAVKTIGGEMTPMETKGWQQQKNLDWKPFGASP